jgi:superfamily I DNA and/or RNA helicase
VKNYRSMPALLMAPSALFYDDTLVPRAQDVRLIKWSGLVNPDVPIAIKGIETEEATIDEGASWYNLGEIDEVVRTIVTLQRDRPDILAKDIAVITPWREQVWRIRTRLRSIGLHGVDVGHVESYQGAEFKVTILSCVRSNARFLASDRKASMGFFNEPKRFNVAITRAKELLVVIGNMNLFKHDEDWLGFLKIATRKNLYQGPALDITVKYRERWNFIE